jgi:AcrR family transcriptional regulator
LRRIGAGRAPAEVTLQELCRAAGVTTGSFYAHFPAGIDDGYQGPLLSRWAGGLHLDWLAVGMQAVRGPADRLWLLTQQMASDNWAPPVMQRWAAVSPAVAAVADAAGTCSSLAAHALEDPGLSEPDSEHGGRLLVRAVNRRQRTRI